MFDITPMEVDLEQHREIHLLMLLPKVKLVKQYKVDIKIAKLPLLKKYKNLYLKKELIRFFILNNIDQRVSTSEVIKIRSLLFLKNSFQKYWLLGNFYYRMLFLLKKCNTLIFHIIDYNIFCNEKLFLLFFSKSGGRI